MKFFSGNLRMQGACYLLVFFLALVEIQPASGQSAINWTGTTSSDWATAANWSSNTVPAASDNVQIGYIAFNNQPIVNASCQVNSISFGSIQPILFTVMQNAAVQVTGNIIQLHSTDNVAPKTTITGNGSLFCNAFIVGNTTTSRIIASKTTSIISTIANLSITTNLTLCTASSDLLSGGKGNNNSSFSLQAGHLAIGGQVKTYHLIPTYLQSIANNKPYAKFSIDIVGSQSPTLVLSDSIVVSVANTITDTINFNNHIAGTGISTVNYSGRNQVVYTNAFSTVNNTFYTYQNLVISGSGIKTIINPVGNTLLVSGSINVTGGSLATQITSSAIKVQAYP